MKVLRLKWLLPVLAVLAFAVSISSAAQSPFDIQSQYLNQARKERVMVTINLISGERLQGYIKSFDDDCILVDSSSDLLLYKHAVGSITATDGSFMLNSEQEF